MISIRALLLLSVALFGDVSWAEDDMGETGLLFHLSGDKGFTADVARGDPEPSFLNDIAIIPDGAVGPGFRCPDFSQVLVYFAPGNIYAERGTLSFFWRARTPWGSTPFHIFQVPYSDHSSLDMIWLRLDYNGGGFDAFVTDVNLARVRVSHRTNELPDPSEWLHFAVTWDETVGIRFYLGGERIAQKDTSAVFFAGLDQFGMHGRLINPQTVRTELNHTRGGDVDEIRIYDRMLDDDAIASLAAGETAGTTSPFVRSLDEERFRDEWLLRYGWDRPDDPPPYLEAGTTVIRSLGIHEVYDLKQWVWKGTDGIRETTWPNVYNRSRLPGRSDYFIEPDWDCYSMSGKAVTFTLPDEPWNYLEVAGAAFGAFTFQSCDREKRKAAGTALFERPPGRELTFHRFGESRRGGRIRFENVEQETPIGEFRAFHIAPGRVPAGDPTLTYTLDSDAAPDNPSLDDLVAYIDGRFMPDERSIIVALPSGAPRNPKKCPRAENPLPVIHALVPFDFRRIRPRWSTSAFSYTWENMHGGLDGVAIDLPALDVRPTHGGLFPMNVQVRDPLWPDRALVDVSFSVKPGEPRTVFLDTRDRILPNGRSLYLVFAGAGGGFGVDDLDGTRIRLVFKDRGEAVAEHVKDRYTQVVDNWGNIAECGPNVKKLRMYDRFIRDLTDLLRVDPGHEQGRFYWSLRNPEQGWPDFEQPEPPGGAPLWAFRQVEALGLVREYVRWWIDERQVENGEFGGGLSDDGDMTNQFPGPALMGIDPDTIAGSVHRLLDAYYNEGLFTGGLPTIVTDELHAYEEGINVIPQAMLLDYGDPETVERLMETAKAYELITDINDRGERQISTGFFGGGSFSKEGVWAVAKTRYSYLILHAGMVLVEYNGHPAAKKLLLEVADGLLAHRKYDENGKGYFPELIFYPSGDDSGRTSMGYTVSLFWACWRWTGDRKYLRPILEEFDGGNYGAFSRINNSVMDFLGTREEWRADLAARVTPETPSDLLRHLAWQATGDKRYLEAYYAHQIQRGTQMQRMYTADHWWIDRVHSFSHELQRSRLGGIALMRNNLYPGHAVSWRFEPPARPESVAILIPDAATDKMTIIAHNLDNIPVTAEMTGWDIEPGRWEIVTGIDSDGDDRADRIIGTETIDFGRTRTTRLTFPPGKTAVLSLRLKKRGMLYWKRPDLGIGEGDVRVRGNKVHVTVHSLGSVDAPESTVILESPGGEVIASTAVSTLGAPLDYLPKTAEVTLTVPDGQSLEGSVVRIEPGNRVREITLMNNTVRVVP